jgi:hypothetical protein
LISLDSHTECSEYTNCQIKNAVAEENNMKYQIDNKSNFFVSKFFPTLIIQKLNLGALSCDALFTFKKNKNDKKFKKAVFVELKNSDVIHAVRQIEKSLNHFNITSNSNLEQVHGRIIPKSTYGPNLNHTEYIKLNRRFMALNGELKTKNKILKDIF